MKDLDVYIGGYFDGVFLFKIEPRPVISFQPLQKSVIAPFCADGGGAYLLILKYIEYSGRFTLWTPITQVADIDIRRRLFQSNSTTATVQEP
jgi:hypothetical protein